MGFILWGIFRNSYLLFLKGCDGKHNKVHGEGSLLRKSISLECILVLLKGNYALTRNIFWTKKKKTHTNKKTNKIFFIACQFFKKKSSRKQNTKVNILLKLWMTFTWIDKPFHIPFWNQVRYKQIYYETVLIFEYTQDIE